jgi:hypothetical protein
MRVKQKLGDNHAMSRLHPVARTIPIRAGLSAAGCGHCAHDAHGVPQCRQRLAETEAHPDLAGPPEQLQRLLPALAPVLGFDARTGAGGLLRTLQVQPGEVTLQLALARHCGADELADTAFHTLRRLLPDTDIFVRFND